MNILIITDELKPDDRITEHVTGLYDNLNKKEDTMVYIAAGANTTNFTGDKIITKDFLKYENRTFRNFFYSITFIRQFCKEHKIDIINTHTIYSSNIALHASYTVKLKRVQTIHYLPEKGTPLKPFTADKYIIIDNDLYYEILNKRILNNKDITLITGNVFSDSINSNFFEKYFNIFLSAISS